MPLDWDHRRAELVQVGSIVRFDLGGRRVRGWVVADDVEPTPGVRLRPLTKVTGLGPPADVVDLAQWAAQRWYGHPSRFLVAASPPRAITSLPAATRGVSAPAASLPNAETHPGAVDPVEAFEAPYTVVRVAPRASVLPYALAAARLGNALVLAPSRTRASWLASAMGRAGVPVALQPEGWARARAGATVVGTRQAAWAPVVDLAAVLVVDEHDEVYKDERTPAWNARDVAIERARRAGAPVVLLSPSPTAEARATGRLLTPDREVERAGWPRVEVIDRRSDDVGRTGLFSDAVVRAIRDTDAGPMLFVLNRKGRARLLACANCGDLATCERCASALAQPTEDDLACNACGLERPVVCANCGGSVFKRLRMGISRAREELEALAGRQVVEVSGDSEPGDPQTSADLFVGTEAVLHRFDRAAVVVFLDFDSELAAVRYRAAEQAFGLLVRAARLVGPRSGGGRLLVQTRSPDHEALRAAGRGDPGILAEVEDDRRKALGMPPHSALASVSGSAAAEFIAGAPTDNQEVAVLGPLDDRYLVRAPDHRTLADFLAEVQRPAGRVRVEVDPLRV